jgi:transposase-like protein
MRARWMWNIRQLLLSVWFEGVALPPSLSHITTESQWRSLKWFTEFGHLNRGDMLTSEQHRCHNEKRNFSAEFKRESAQLVVDQNYTVADAASAMDVGLSTMTRWVKQLRDERQGKTPKASPLPRNKLKSVSSGKSYNVLKWKMKY